MLTQIKKIIKNIIFSFIKPETKIINSSYSQFGEDVIVRNLLNSMGIQNILYLDVGVCHPDYFDNTYLFYKHGSRGVCVEANPAMIEIINTVRGDDKIINVGVGAKKAGEADFFMFDDPNLNTFDKNEAWRRNAIGKNKIIKSIKVPVMSINQIIKENFKTYPHFISLDIEGLDLDVLKSLNFSQYPIPVICVETCSYSDNYIKPKIKEFDLVMDQFGYFMYADTYVNTIYVNQKWFYNGEKIISGN